ncbi:MAG: LacI family DNA-binding transcriptional regulator [Victivallales bacterium]
MVSMKDIAKVCNVSESTVSKALKGHPLIKRETRKQIQEVALKYNYQPNAMVESIQTGRSRTIGIAYNNFYDSFAGAIVTGIFERLCAAGYEAIIICWDELVSHEAHVFSRFSRRRVDGLLLFPPRKLPTSEYLRELRAFHNPIVVIDQTWPGNEFSYVGSDNVLGAALATEHMIERGISDIGFIKYSTVSSGNERWQGFVETMQKHGLPVKDSWCIDAGGFPEYGHELILKMLSRSDRPKGLVCFNDYCACHAASAAHELGIRIPEELSLVGFGDIHMLPTLLHPKLTTVKQFPEDIGRKAADILLESIKGGKEISASKNILMPVELICRDSVRRK